MTNQRTREEEISRNFEAFQAQIDQLIDEHAGKYALLRDTQIVEYFDTPRDAMVYAVKTYDDGLFSIQHVDKGVVDLGWFSHAPAYASV